MAYKLGVDLGTASIGAVAIRIENNEPQSIDWQAVRIFSESVVNTPKGLQPKKAVRRDARQLRKQIERRARRLRRIANLIPLLGLHKAEVKPGRRQDLTTLRAIAARQQVELHEFALVLLRLAKRRGYAGGFRDSKDGVVKSSSDKLSEEMRLLAETQNLQEITLGEYLLYRQEHGLPVWLKAERPGLEPRYALREMVTAEFEQLWTTQARYHPILASSHLGKPLKQWFNEALFYQQPLKSPAHMVGNCLLEPNLPRAPRAHMAAQHFRINKTLHDMRWGSGRRAERLCKAQLDVLRQILNDPANADGKVSFKHLHQALSETGLSDARSRTLNLERSSRDQLPGNSTIARWRTLGLHDQWQMLAPRDQTTIINLLADLGGPELLVPDDWHQNIRKSSAKAGDTNLYRRFRPEVVDFINALRECKDNNGQPAFNRLTAMKFEGGRSSYSVKALEKLNSWFNDPWWPDEGPGAKRGNEIDEEAALRVCYPHRYSRPQELLQRLEAAPTTGNDVVDGALRELRKIINQCIDALGERPEEIVVEMAREIGKGVVWRKEQENRIRQNELARRKIASELEKHGLSANNTRILRYQLWEEQDLHWCPYCAHPINLEAATSGMTHIEHVLPRSLTQIGRKRSELVLAHAGCNDLKADQTPWQAFGHDAERWSAVERAAARFRELGNKSYAKDRAKAMGFYRKAELLLLKDYESEVLSDESIANFADRQLHQTSWIAKAAAQWLRTITPLVSVSRGEFTALLRHQWRLDTVIAEARLDEKLPVLDIDACPVSPEAFQQFRKQWEGHPPDNLTERTERKLEKRLDHRHHGIDALVIALTSRSLYMSLARRYVEESERRAPGERVQHDWSIEPTMHNLRNQALGMVRTCNLTHKPDRNPAGRLFKDTAYGVHFPEEGDRAQLTLRKPLISLADEKSAEKTRKNLHSIASSEVRLLVLKAFEARLSVGQNPKQALSEPVPYPAYGTAIWRVRCIQGYADDAVRIIHKSRQGEHEKRLLNDGYACLEITAGENGKHQVRLVTQREAQGRGFMKNRQQAKRIFKRDTVIDRRDDRKYLVGYFKAEGYIFLIPHTDTRNFDKIKEANSGKKSVSFNHAHQLERI
jgi:CRISPR-associated endonuclease Csn1